MQKPLRDNRQRGHSHAAKKGHSHVALTAYANLEDARLRVGAFIEDVYIADRLHAALGRQSPAAFEAEFRKTADQYRQPLTALAPN